MTNMISQNHDGNAKEAPLRVDVLEELIHRAAVVKFVPGHGQQIVFYQAVYTIYITLQRDEKTLVRMHGYWLPARVFVFCKKQKNT